MPSLVPDFEYDIFISYRQNDNLPSRGHGKPVEPGWVTEFVQSLNEQLQATMKERVSVYFDENPHDGLQETHDVDESLKGKLKCLIFIPIISQTYCDPKSFAWQHEFLPFKTMAEKDQFGLKIKLQNGNVTSRVLPVRIHELDETDKRILEEQLGPLRGVDFVFKSSGVNRPITPVDKKEDNTNKIVFRDQVNKVANSIKDLINAIQNPDQKSSAPVQEMKTPKKLSKPAIWLSAILMIMFFTFWILSLKRTDQESSTEKKSIAVIPFDNLSASATNEMLCLSLSEDILTKLASLHELKVPSRISSSAYRNSKKSAKVIGEELGVQYILEGSVLVNGEDIRVTAILVNAENDEIIWTKPFNRKLADYFKLQGEVAQKVVSSLEINLGSRESSVTNAEQFDLKAYELYKKGLSLLDKGTVGLSMNTVLPYFEDALKIDSTLYPAWVAIANSYIKVNYFGYTKAKDVKDRLWNALEKARALKSDYPPLYASLAAAALNFDFDEKAFKEYNSKAKELDPNNPQVYFDLAIYYAIRGEYPESIKMFDMAVELNPAEVQYYDYHKGFVHYLNRQYDKAIESYNHALEIEPGYELALWGLGVTYNKMGEYQKSVDFFHRRPRGTDTNWALANPLAKLGRLEDVRKILDYQLTRSKVTFVPPAVIGHIYLALGEKQEACRWMQKQIGDGGIFWLYMVKLEPRLDEIRGEECYKEFEKKIPL